MGEEMNNKIYISNGHREYQELKSATLFPIDEVQQDIQPISKECSQKFEGTIEMRIKDFKKFKKALKINHISKKRAKKLLMAKGVQRNIAEKILARMQEVKIPREQWRIEQIEILYNKIKEE